jgi:hypothetical protein
MDATEAYCFEACVRGSQLTAKCQGRAEAACVELDVGVAACLPSCGSDDQCPAGRYCDVLGGACVDTQFTGDPTGAACDLMATTNTCQGGCLDVGGGVGMCSGYCSLGLDYPACGSDPTAANAAGEPVCFPLFGDTDGVNDLGACVQLCDSSPDCLHPGMYCEPFADLETQTAFRAQGFCNPVLETVADGGLGGDAG